MGLAGENTTSAVRRPLDGAAAALAAQSDLASPLALYAEGIDDSDYVAAVAPKVRGLIGQAASLLDVGAGAGQLGAALCGPFSRWLALEPDAEMHARLAGLRKPKPAIIAAGWEKLTALNLKPQDVSLAANIGAPLTDARLFYQALRPLSRRAMVWIVPAQAGPRGMCLAACLDPTWHGEDMRPGHEIVLGALGADAPDHVTFADWTFRGRFPSLAHVEAHYLRGLKWLPDDLRIPALRACIGSQAQQLPKGVMLAAPKKSAILIWTFSS
jgi:hypothetical protein